MSLETEGKAVVPGKTYIDRENRVVELTEIDPRKEHAELYDAGYRFKAFVDGEWRPYDRFGNCQLNGMISSFDLIIIKFSLAE